MNERKKKRIKERKKKREKERKKGILKVRKMWPYFGIWNKFWGLFRIDVDLLHKGYEDHYSGKPCVQMAHTDIDSEPNYV